MPGPVRRCAVLGSPIAHSLSPVLHRAAYRTHRLPWTYSTRECTEEGLPALLGSLDDSWRALSLTMPLKRAVLPLLDEVSALGSALGAVNTVLLDDDGVRRGHNTDVVGVQAALAELPASRPRAPLLLGAGGAAAAVLAALADSGVAEVRVAVRTPGRADELSAVGSRVGVGVIPVGFHTVRAELDDSDLVVACTPAGATDELALGGWPRGLALFDLLYHPWPTALVRAAVAAGAPVVGGLPMLVAQAAEAFTLASGLPAPLAAMRADGEAALAAR